MTRLKILMYADSYNGRVGQGANYMSFFSQFGEVILVSADNELENFIKLGDVLAIPGGADVDPARYGEKPHYSTGRPNAQYEWLDKHLLTPWLATGKPIIGICRGMQTLNVAAGGTLWQDLHHHVGGEDRTELGHKLYTTVPGFEIVDVNSYHHQGVRKLAPGFKDIGYSMLYQYCPTTRLNTYFKHKFIKNKDKKGGILKSKETFTALCEVMQHETKPWLAFQYHPEDFNCPLALHLVDEMLGKYFQDYKPNVKPNYRALGYAGGFYQERALNVE